MEIERSMPSFHGATAKRELREPEGAAQYAERSAACAAPGNTRGAARILHCTQRYLIRGAGELLPG